MKIDFLAQSFLVAAGLFTSTLAIAATDELQSKPIRSSVDFLAVGNCTDDKSVVKPFDLSTKDMPIASMVAVDKSDIGRISDGEYLVLKFEKEMYKRDSERYQKENDILRKIIHYDWDKKVEEKRREVEEYKRKYCLDAVCRQTPPKAMEVDVMVDLAGINDELHSSEYRSLDMDDVPDKYVGEIFSDNSPGW